MKEQLHQFNLDNYAKALSPPPTTQPAVTEKSGSPQKVNFTAWYKRCPSAVKDELKEFYKPPQEDFNTCDPIQWWSGHHLQFPNLSRLVQDILVIPGEFTLSLPQLISIYLLIILPYY
jgi:hypothetical protein